MIDLEKVKEERRKAVEHLRNIDDLLAAARKLCNHQWQYDGQDHNFDYYKCSLCEESRSE
jgi:hypothetical protein